MSLSVITLVKNRSGHLGQLIEGLRRSDPLPEELVIVDMGERSLVPAGLPFPVRLVIAPSAGLPLARARNRGFRESACERLLFLDVDCIPGARLVGLMAAALDRHDALICADIRYLAAGDAGPGWTEEGLLAAGQPHPVRHFPPSGVREEGNAGLFWSLAFGIRRQRFAALGGFDEGFCGYGAEDTDFSFRAAAAGTPLLMLGGAQAFHQHHAVYHPPLQHFDDIVRNAQRFRRRWGFWPMEGWLEAFERQGLLVREANHLRCLRRPDTQAVAAARQPPGIRF